MRRHLARLRPALVAGLLLLPGPASAQRFRPDDPLRADPDRLPIPRPAEIELATAYDVIEHTFHHRPQGSIPPAANVNTLGDVPDSSWFSNRIGVRGLTLEELARGPATEDGPDTSMPWTVTGGKSSGISPGFTIRDGRGRLFFLKFDPVQHPNLATSVEVIGSKFFHAIGYNVPQNFIVRFRRDQLVIGPGAQLRRGPKKRPMVPRDLDDILAGVARLPDGRIRAVASRGLPGQPVGPYKFHGRRGDDPNDVFPHEHRRDLRGYRVFCAWLNHDDSRSVNTIDVYLGEAGHGHLDHYLIDFSSILGAGSDAERRIGPQNPRAGNEYVIGFGPMVKAAITLGIWVRPWRRVRYPHHPEIGRIEAEFFRPERWKPEYPNPAFERMLPEDAFWAAKIVARFSDEAIRAIVRTGEYDDPAGERYLADTVIKRRDKIVAHYFRLLNPLDRFRAEGGPEGRRLAFDNLSEQARLAPVDGYEYQWFRFNNRTGETDPLGGIERASRPSLPLPEPAAEYLLVRIRTLSAETAWRKKVQVYLRRHPALTVVGIERES
jgi:hypothetical protein